MAIMSFFLDAPVLDNWIGQLLQLLYEWVGNFGWTVVIFTVILKTVLLPLDIWQKSVTVKNNRAMKRMKPQLEKLQKQFANNREQYGAKQMELYKKEGYSIMGACLPMFITIAIFFIVFGGFNKMVKYHNETVVYEMVQLYNDGASETELKEAYAEKMEGWLWIKNVFMPDTWADVVPSYKTYSGSGLGKLNAEFPDNYTGVGGYESLMAPIMTEYNKANFWDFENWNGYIILPILAVILNILTSVLMKNSQPEQPPQIGPDGKPMNNAVNMKMMQYMMPLMIGVFSLFYSAAFTIYLFFSAAYTGLFNLIFNRINAAQEKKLEAAAAPNRRI